MKIFLSYRRKDLLVVGIVNALFDRLSAMYGAGNVFVDVDSVPLGQDFRKVLDNGVGQADVVLAIIGPQWMDLLQEKKTADNDYVRVEIESALNREIPVVPLLIGEAQMPKASELPDSLRQLAYCHGFKIDPRKRFESDANRLITELDRNYRIDSSMDPAIQNKPAAALPADHWKGIGAAVIICLVSAFGSIAVTPDSSKTLIAIGSILAFLFSLAWICGKYHISLVPSSEVGHLPKNRFVARIVVNIALLVCLGALGNHFDAFTLTGELSRRFITILFVANLILNIVLMFGSYVEVFWYPGRETDMRGHVFRVLLLPVLFSSSVICWILSTVIAVMILKVS